jgi:hypothetical protein
VTYPRYVPLHRGLGQYDVIGGAITGATQAGTAVAGGGLQKLVISAPQIAGSTLTGIATSSGTLWGMSATMATTVIGAAVAGITIALMLIFGRKGPKQKVATTQIVNTVEPHLKDNLAGYLSGPRTRTSQAQAIENFKAAWQYVVDHCGIPEMGDPGQACIHDRQAGGKWPWTTYYLDPIVNDPQVKDDPVIDTVTGALTQLVTDPVTGQVTAVPFGETGNQYTWLVLAALAVGAALMLGGGK